MKSSLRAAAIIETALAAVSLISLLRCLDITVGTLHVPLWGSIVLFGALFACSVVLWIAAAPPRPGQVSLPDTGPEPNNGLLLEEYKLSQASAEHHDKLIWSTTGLVWGASLVLLGFVFKDLKAPTDPTAVFVVGLLGLALTTAVWWMACIWNTVMRLKYRRCQEIERRLGLRQNLNVEAAYPHGRVKLLYAVVSVLFVYTWLTVICQALCAGSDRRRPPCEREPANPALQPPAAEPAAAER